MPPSLGPMLTLAGGILILAVPSLAADNSTASVPTFVDRAEASGLRFAIVVSRFNEMISLKLLDGCTSELIRCGAREEDIDIAWVPGACSSFHPLLWQIVLKH